DVGNRGLLRPHQPERTGLGRHRREQQQEQRTCHPTNELFAHFLPRSLRDMTRWRATMPPLSPRWFLSLSGRRSEVTHPRATSHRDQARGRLVPCASNISTVMPALVAGIHVFLAPPPYPPPLGREGRERENVDGRDKPGHDSGATWFNTHYSCNSK